MSGLCSRKGGGGRARRNARTFLLPCATCCVLLLKCSVVLLHRAYGSRSRGMGEMAWLKENGAPGTVDIMVKTLE